MNRNDYGCPERRDSLTLLVYLEGGLGHDARQEMEAHLRVCAWCRSELDNLRRADTMLRAHPEAFHPDAEDLHRFAATGFDPDGVVTDHLAVCDACREDVSLLRELAEAGVEAQSAAPGMPRRLKARVRALVRKPLPVASWWQRASKWLSAAWTGLPRAPMFAVGTAVGVLVVAVLVVPQLERGKAPLRVDRSWELPQGVEEAPAPELVPEGTTPALPKPRFKEGQPEAEMRSFGTRQPRMAVPPGRADETLPPEGAPPNAPPTALSDKNVRAMKRQGAPEPLKRLGAERSEPSRAMGTAPAPKDALIGTPSPSTLGAAPQTMVTREAALPRVRIVDEHGRDIPWLNVDPGLVADLHGYRLPERDESKVERESVDARKPAKQESRPEERVASQKGLSVLVRVVPDGSVFTVEASLKVDGETFPQKTRSEAHVPKDKLQETVNSLVHSLVGNR
ncbi:MAG: hypothetical protein LDL33_05700 [Desulfomonile sp.]|nr:hypothetical protein [Desulfomonile sp.]